MYLYITLSVHQIYYEIHTQKNKVDIIIISDLNLQRFKHQN